MTLIEDVIQEARKVYDRDASIAHVVSAIDQVTTALAPEKLAALCVEVIALRIQIRIHIDASGTIYPRHAIFYALNEAIAVLMLQQDDTLRAVESKRVRANIRHE